MSVEEAEDLATEHLVARAGALDERAPLCLRDRLDRMEEDGAGADRVGVHGPSVNVLARILGKARAVARRGRTSCPDGSRPPSLVSAEAEALASQIRPELCCGVLFLEGRPEPGAGVRPRAVGGGPRQSEGLGGLLHWQSGEIVELDEVGREGVLRREGV
jgi:hypothetical protein